jgi:D-cysteine desulfhydrase/L-cysteate sulfo-lyase
VYKFPNKITTTLNGFPRISLVSQETPLEKLSNLTKVLNKNTNNFTKLFIKRDDLTGLATGGNKTRPLEFILGEAISKKCNQIIITGAVQSNYYRSAEAAAAKLGIGCHIQLENRILKMDQTYHQNGNVLLYKLFGAEVSFFSKGENEDVADRELLKISTYHESIGKKPYIINLSPDYATIGALGYIDAIKKISIQCRTQSITLDGIVTASGTA